MKKIIKSIDRHLFRGWIEWLFLNRMGIVPLLSNYGYPYDTIKISFAKNKQCQLATLCDRYGSDKGEIKKGPHPYPWQSHSYTHFYSRMLSPRRNDIQYVFECGIGTNNPDLLSSMGEDGKPGASLRVWQDYFPNAQIIGVDIDESILFHENRIATYALDQTNPTSIQALWQKLPDVQFDLMIDDGLHIFAAGRCLFENAIHKLRPGGLYIIEDVLPNDLLAYQHYFADKPYTVDFVRLSRHGQMLPDNNLVVIYG